MLVFTLIAVAVLASLQQPNDTTLWFSLSLGLTCMVSACAVVVLVLGDLRVEARSMLTTFHALILARLSHDNVG